MIPAMAFLQHRSPAVAANADLTPKRYPDLTGEELQNRILKKVIVDNDLSPDDIDGLLATPTETVNTEEGDAFAHEALVDQIGIEPSITATVNVGGASHGFMLYQAALAIDAGLADSVLCLSAGKFPQVDKGGEYMAEMTSHREFEFPWGTFIPAMYALTVKRYMHEYDVTKDDLAQVSVSARRWAQQNPKAYMHGQGPLTVDDVLSSPAIADPFHRLHCSVPTDGGGAFLVTSGKKARQLTDQPAYIRGIGFKSTHGYISQAPSFTTLGVRESGRRAFEMASLSPSDVKVAEIYDAFASNPPMYAEDLGFAEKGEGTELFKSGQTDPGGDLPINTYGGLHSFGHSGDSSGISMINEAITQTMGDAGDRQVDGADIVLSHSYGGMQAEHTTILFGRNPA